MMICASVTMDTNIVERERNLATCLPPAPPSVPNSEIDSGATIWPWNECKHLVIDSLLTRLLSANDTRFFHEILKICQNC